MKILLTGSTGFIGSHLLRRLRERGDLVWTLERYVAGRLRRDRRIFGDLRNGQRMVDVIRGVQPDAIVHLAALTPVAHSYREPQDYLDTNLVGTISLAEAARFHAKDLRQFLFASTSETYGDAPDFPIYENLSPMPNSPYSVSKVACEHYLRYMQVAYRFPVTVLRPFNTYGRRRNRHYVVESIATQMLEGKDLHLGSPLPERDFLYVDDHVNAYLMALENPKAIGRTYNVCTGQAISIEKLVEELQGIVGWDGKVHWDALPPRPWDIMKLQGAYGRIKEELGWYPRVSLRDGLQKTVTWWRERLEQGR